MSEKRVLLLAIYFRMMWVLFCFCFCFFIFRKEDCCTSFDILKWCLLLLFLFRGRQPFALLTQAWWTTTELPTH